MRTQRPHGAVPTILTLSAVLLAACAPTISSLQPPQGPPRTLVNVNGSQLFLATVHWDRGLAGEATVPTSLGGNFFSVPTAAATGPHPLAAVSGSNVSNVVNFTVNGPMPAWPAPRINDVTVNQFRVGTDGKAAFWQ